MDDWILQSNAYVLTYMITNHESFSKIDELIQRVKTIKRTTKIPMIMVGRFLGYQKATRKTRKAEKCQIMKLKHLPKSIRSSS